MGTPGSRSLRIAVVGGGPAGSFFALHALRYARQAGRDLSITIYEGKDFLRPGPSGCNMCAGIVPVSDLALLRALDVHIPPEMILSRVNSYALHTSAGTLRAAQPDAGAEIISVYRGAGPRRGESLGPVSFDDLLIEGAVAQGALLRRAFVQTVRRGPPAQVVSEGESELYDLVVLATGVNGRGPILEGFDYRPPPTGSMVQTELQLGREEVGRLLGSSVHIFLPPDEVAGYGILIPKGPFVTVSLLSPRAQMRSLRQFLDLPEVVAILGDGTRPACGCLPSISVGMAGGIAGDGFVAIGDSSATRLYKNGIGSALATAERAAWTVVHRGCARADFEAAYLPLCRAIDLDNRVGRLLFLQVPILKRSSALSMAHYRLSAVPRCEGACKLHTRILWGMFTGAHSYRHLLRMAMSPGLFFRLAVALGGSSLSRGHARSAPSAPFIPPTTSPRGRAGPPTP